MSAVESSVPTARRRPPVEAWLGAGALAIAVFFQGPQIALLAGVQALLVAWLALAIARSYSVLVLPRTAVALAVTAFWAWLAISLVFSSAPGTSVMTFWWVGTLPLAFWVYTLTPDRERLWPWLLAFAVSGTALLCAHALVQVFAYGHPPRSTFVNIHSFAALVMLVALPASGVFLGDSAWPKRFRALLGGVLFLFFFTIAATQGRGTTVSLLIALGAMLLLVGRSVPRRSRWLLVGIVASGYVAANLLLHGAVGARLSSLADPATAGLPRFLIWKGSLQMALDHPWLGVGLGLYYLAWPPYRDPTDPTLGFFAHNDYLHIWIETGLPGLLCLIAILAALLALFIRFLRAAALSQDRRIEVVALFCGLLGVALHSFLDFNLYILSISVWGGLVLGRLHELVAPTLHARAWRLEPRSIFQAPAFRLIVALLALFPIFYFVALGLSDHFYRQAFVMAAQGRLDRADSAFGWAERLTAGDDKVLLAHADLYRHVLGRLPLSAGEERRALYREAVTLLEHAEAANRYRAMVHAVRAKLFQENRDQAGTGWYRAAEAEYREALALNPRLFHTRVEYGLMLLAAGEAGRARQAMEEGLRYWYFPDPALIDYYQLVARLARDAGESERVTELQARIEQVKLDLSNLAPARTIAPETTATVPAPGSSL